MEIRNKFTFDVSWILLSQVATLGLGFLLNVFLGRWLGAAEFGLYMMALTIFTITAMLTSFGIPQSIVKFVAECKENQSDIDRIVSCGIVNVFVLGLVAAGVLILLSGTIAATFDMPALATLVPILALAIPLSVVNSTLLSMLSGLREMKSYSLRAILRSILLISLTSVFILIGWGVTGAIYALLLTEIAIFIFMVLITIRYFHFFLGDFRNTSKTLMTFSYKVFLAGAIYSLNTYTDTLLVGYFLLDRDVGIYSIAIAISRFGFLAVPSAVSTVSYPAISEYFSKNLLGAIENLMNKSMKICLVFLSIVGIFIIFLAEEIILFLLSPEYLEAIMPLSILIIGMIFFGCIQSIGSAASAMNRPDLAFKNNVYTAIINISLDVILIPFLGITGAALGTSISFLFLALNGIRLSRCHLNVNVEYRVLVTTLMMILLLVLVFELLKNSINHYLLMVVLFTGYLGFVYVIILTGEEKRYLGQFLSSLSSVFSRQ